MKFLKVLLGIALVLPLVGCTGMGPFSGMPYAGGDSDHDSAYCNGPGQVWYGSVEQDEDGEWVPSGEGWLVTCEAGGVAYWQQGASANADLYVDMIRQAAEGAAAGASPAP